MIKEVQIVVSIQDKSKCSGCSACYSICPKNCISMVEDNEGFLYPKADKNSCINCGLCDEVCPLNEENNQKNGVVCSSVIQHKDKRILRQSTSGGAFTPIAEYILEQDGVVFCFLIRKEYLIVKQIKI